MKTEQSAQAFRLMYDVRLGQNSFSQYVHVVCIPGRNDRSRSAWHAPQNFLFFGKRIISSPHLWQADFVVTGIRASFMACVEGTTSGEGSFH
jgi:hypothetical protein